MVLVRVEAEVVERTDMSSFITEISGGGESCFVEMGVVDFVDFEVEFLEE